MRVEMKQHHQHRAQVRSEFRGLFLRKRALLSKLEEVCDVFHPLHLCPSFW